MVGLVTLVRMATLVVAGLACLPGAAMAASPDRLISVGAGVQIRVVEAVSEGASEQPVVLIPGWSTGADIWRDEMGLLASGRRVVSFDPRSQGLSTKVVTDNTPERRAEDLRSILSQLKLRKPVLVGWSQAVQDIAAYVMRYGTKDLSGIVLVDAAIASGARSLRGDAGRAAATFDRLALYEASQERYLRGMFGAIISKPQPEGSIDALVATGMQTPSSIGTAMLVADLFGRDRTAALQSIKCPLLVISSASSGELQVQRVQAAAVEGAKMVVIEDAAHAVFLDQPRRFHDALSQFLATLDRKYGAWGRRRPGVAPQCPLREGVGDRREIRCHPGRPICLSLTRPTGVYRARRGEFSSGSRPGRARGQDFDTSNQCRTKP